MRKTVLLVTNSYNKFNSALFNYLVSEQYKVIWLNNQLTKNSLEVSTHEFEINKGTFEYDTTIQKIKKSEIQVDNLVYGIDSIDEDDWLENYPNGFTSLLPNIFNQIYKDIQIVINQMISNKSGNIIFPMISDVLYYAGFPSSPTLNQAKLSLTKCLSKELSAFKISVNCVTFGYFDDDFDRDKKKKIKNNLKVFSLKPRLETFEAHFYALNAVMQAPQGTFGGQNIEVGYGTDIQI